MHGRLAEQHGRDVRRRRGRLDLARERLGEHEPADAQAGRDRLREGGAVDRRAVGQLEQRRQRLSLVAHEPVRVVLEDEQVVLAGELDDPPAALLAQRPAARVLEGRDQIEERRRARRRAAPPRAHPDRGRARRSRAPTTSAPSSRRIFSGRS